MTTRKRSIASAVLAAIAVLSLGAYGHFAYQSGCAADLKTGSLGDPELAMALGRKAFGFLGAALLTGAAAILCLPRLDTEVRVGCAGAYFFVGGVAALFAGFFLESAGVQACFAP